MKNKLTFLLLAILFISCQKEDSPVATIPNPATSNLPVIVAKTSNVTNGTITNVQIFNYDLQGSSNESSNGTIYYDNHLIISPGTQQYMSPLHFMKKNDVWTLESASYGNIIDRARNIYKVSSGTFVWANAGTESETNPTGNLYISKTNSDNSITWNRISDKTKAEFYHYAASGDMDGDNISDVLSYVGVETQSPELFKLFSGTNFSLVNTSFPIAYEFESKLGITQDAKKIIDGGFSFGSITVADVDKSTPGNELILTSTKVEMNKFYSFILMSYDKVNRKFYISKIIKPGGLLLEKGMAVADVRTGDFNDDGNIDIAVSMGDYKNNSGIQVWNNDGNGNFTPNKLKFELYGDAYPNKIWFSNFEVGKFRGHDCIFLHFEGARYVPRPQTNFDLNPFLLISEGNEGAFLHQNMIPIQSQAPGYVKGYFENNSLRLIGIRTSEMNAFELTDLTIK